ncbi:MAG: hypothetical protein WAL92_13160, partial [Thiogranum sp.]
PGNGIAAAVSCPGVARAGCRKPRASAHITLIKKIKSDKHSVRESCSTVPKDSLPANANLNGSGEYQTDGISANHNKAMAPNHLISGSASSRN